MQVISTLAASLPHLSAPAPAEATLAFADVSKRYRNGTLALDGVTWSIAPGARACLLGPNGAGKSTSIRLLQGALTPTTGRVTLLGADVNGADYLEARRRTGIVPQGPGMYTDLTTIEYLTLARDLYGHGSVDEMMEVFGLESYRDKMLAQLSGGYQRRVAMATALMSEPDLLLLDEPTVGLDPVAMRDVQDYLRQAMAGRTTLLCTHNLAEAEALCDEVVILRHGKVLVQATLAGLRRRVHPQLRLAARQGQETLLVALQARGLLARPALDGGMSVLLDTTDPEADAAGILRDLLAAGLDIYVCQPVQATLETLFLDLIRTNA